MVCSGAPEEKSAAETMAMGSERAKPLHNFNLPWDLKWGNQRHLRCMKVSSDGEGSGSGADRRSSAAAAMVTTTTTSRRREAEFERARRFRGTRIEVAAAAEEGIEAVREKVMFDFKAEADKMKYAIFKEGEAATAAAEEDEDEDEDVEMAEVGESSPSPAVAAADARPWNLRTRRAACKAPIVAGGGGGGGAKGLRIEERKANYAPMRSEAAAANNGGGGAKSPRLVRGGASGSGSGSGSGQEKERPKFSVSLSKKEIEDDFMAMLGHRPPRRPKRRPRNVQKQIDTVFPGMWLTEVSAENYKVPEFPENAKR